MEQNKSIEAKILALVRLINADEFQEPHTTGNSLDDVYNELLFLEKKIQSKKDRTEEISEQISNCYGGDFFNFLPISEHQDELDVFCMGFNTYIEELRDAMVSKKLLEISNQNLLQEKERSENLAKAKDVFLSSMSHEIRTPLNGMLGFTDLLYNNKNIDPESKKQIEFIKMSGEILLVIINDILDLAKIESGEITIFKRSFDLNTLTHLINDTFHKKIKDKKIKFSYSIDKNVPLSLTGDSIRISQVLFNLMSNAIKFTPKKGKVQLRFQLESETETNYAVRITVKDSGIGIPDDKLETIFNPFVQVTTDNARTNSGTGLGLTIIKKLITMMNGKIKVKSKINEGTKFSVILPFSKINEYDFPIELVEPKIEPMPEITLDYNIKVLLAEDNRINQILVQKVLFKHKIECVTVGNGKLAVEAMENDDFDIILMDIMMPIMDGYEATALIRKFDNKVKNSIPIIALTAIVTGTVVEDSAAVGVNKYLSKPFDPSTLVATIVDLVQEKRSLA